MRWFIIGTILVSSWACQTPEQTPEQTGDPLACASFVVPHQFGFEWTQLNHRVSVWSNRLSPLGNEACVADTLDMTVIGGDFSTGERFDDNPVVQFGYQPITRSTTTPFGASRLSVELNLPPPGLSTRHLAIDRTTHHLLGYADVHALIEGFSFRTDVEQTAEYPDSYDPAHGYTSRGLGIELTVTEVTESAVHLQVDVRFEHGLSDRDKMNAAIPYAKTAAIVDVLLIGTTTSVPVRTGEVLYDLNYPLLDPLSKERFEPASEEKQTVVLKGKANKGIGHYGWTALDFHLAPSSDVDPNGDHGYYIRAFHADIDLKQYDSNNGEATFLMNGYASNTSEAWSYYALNHTFQGKMAWFQWANSADTVSLTPSINTGSASVPLPGSR